MLLLRMNKTIEIGTINQLRIDRFTTPGAFLAAQDGEDVLLPNAYLSKEMDLDDIIEVFIYTDSEDRLIATTKRPKISLGESGLLEIVSVKDFGAFANWGLPKDLFIPKSCQKRPFKEGEKRFLRVVLDEKYKMLIGDEKVGKHLSKDLKDLEEGQNVDCVVIAKTPLGFKVIVNKIYEGTIFENEVFSPLKVGDNTKGYIKKKRFDGKLDISLRKIGEDKDKATQELILEMLKNKSVLPFNYKSSPEEIKKTFHTSRKGFKRSLTALIEKEAIEIVENAIVLK